MNRKKILCGLLAAALVCGALSGCGGSGKTETLETGKTLSDSSIRMTVEAVAVDEQITAPFSDSETGALNAYHAQTDGTAYQYADCIATVQNTSSSAFDPNELTVTCSADGETYTDYLLLAETADGVELAETDAIAAGATARIHYAIVLPESVSADSLAMNITLPNSGTTYTAQLTELAPHATQLQASDSVTSEAGVSLTLNGVSAADSVSSLSQTLSASEGNQLLDAAFAVSNSSSAAVSVGTLYAGMLLDGTSSVSGIAVAEDSASGFSYDYSIQPGETATVHLLFDVSADSIQNGTAYLYFDDMYYSLPAAG